MAFCTFVSGIKNQNECVCLDSMFRNVKYDKESSSCNMTCHIEGSDYPCGGESSISVYVAGINLSAIS